jgi:hypothetical protein
MAADTFLGGWCDRRTPLPPSLPPALACQPSYYIFNSSLHLRFILSSSDELLGFISIDTLLNPQ